MVKVFAILYLDVSALKDGLVRIVKIIKMNVLYFLPMNNVQDLGFVMKRKDAFVLMDFQDQIVKFKELIAELVHLDVLEKADVIEKKGNVNVKVDSKETLVKK